VLLQSGEKGGDPATIVPAGLMRLFQHPKLDWNLFSTKQQHMNEKEVHGH
jgi:hypothetical protein